MVQPKDYNRKNYVSTSEKNIDDWWNNEAWPEITNFLDDCRNNFRIGTSIREISASIATIASVVDELKDHIRNVLETMESVLIRLDNLLDIFTKLAEDIFKATYDAQKLIEYERELTDSKTCSDHCDRISKRIKEYIQMDMNQGIIEAEKRKFREKFEELEMHFLRCIRYRPGFIQFLETSDIFICWMALLPIYCGIDKLPTLDENEKSFYDLVGDLEDWRVYRQMKSLYLNFKKGKDDFFQEGFKKLADKEKRWGVFDFLSPENANYRGASVFSYDDKSAMFNRVDFQNIHQNREYFTIKSININFQNATYSDIELNVIRYQNGQPILREVQRDNRIEAEAERKFNLNERNYIESSIKTLLFPSIINKSENDYSNFFNLSEPQIG